MPDVVINVLTKADATPMTAFAKRLKAAQIDLSIASDKLRVATGKLNEAFASGAGSVNKEFLAVQRTEMAVLRKSAALDGLRAKMSAVDSTSQSFLLTVWELRGQLIVAAGIVAGFGKTFQQVFEFGKQGAAVEQVTKSFEHLVRVSGTYPDLLERLREAARGTITDFDLMASTMTVVAGTTGDLQKQLLDTVPLMLEIAKAANILNPALGDVQYMFDSITQGVKRQERRILDNLGIIVRLREANTRYADAMNTTVEEMTAEEIQQSFLNEALRVGALLIEQVGGSVDSAVDPFMQLTTEAENLKNEFAVLAFPTISLLVSGLTDIIKIQQVLTLGFRDEKDAILGSANTYDEYIKQLEKVQQLEFLISSARVPPILWIKTLKDYADETRNNLTPAMWQAYQSMDATDRQREAQSIPLIKEETEVASQLAQFGLQQIGLKGNEATIAELALQEAIDPTNASVNRQKLAIMQLAQQYDITTKQGLYEYLNALLQTVTSHDEAARMARVYTDALEAERVKLEQTARSQAILNAQLAGARAGFGGQFAGLVDGYTAKIAALNDQLAKAGGGGGRPEKPVDMEEARLREAVAAGDLRDAYGDLNEIEGKITEQEKMLAEARESGADPAWIEYLEGSIQHLKDEQARAKLAIYEKQKALTELQNILNGVAEAEDNYAASSGGAASAAINLKDEIAKLNNELDKEITKMVVMAAVNKMLEDPTTESIDAALALGEAFGVVDAASAVAIKTATLLGEAWKAGVIDNTELTTMTEGIITALEINVPRAAETAKGKIEEVVDKEKAADALKLVEETFADISERMLLTGTDAETTAGQIGAISAVLSETAGNKGAFARHNIDTKKTLPEAVKDSITALEELDLAFLNSHKEGSGLYGFRLAIKDLIDKLADMITKIQIAKGELGIGGTTNTGTGDDGELATGGPVYRNRPRLVGERGPEMFLPSSNGQIIPNHQLISGGRKRGRGNGGINVSGSLTINLEGVKDADSLLESLRDALGVA